LYHDALAAYVECVVVVTGAAPLVVGLVGAAGATVETGAEVTGVTTTPVTSPLTAFFCFVDDVGIRRRRGPTRRYRMRMLAGLWATPSLFGDELEARFRRGARTLSAFALPVAGE
jgi:hypothetical protein